MSVMMVSRVASGVDDVVLVLVVLVVIKAHKVLLVDSQKRKCKRGFEYFISFLYVLVFIAGNFFLFFFLFVVESRLTTGVFSVKFKKVIRTREKGANLINKESNHTFEMENRKRREKFCDERIKKEARKYC